MVDDHWYRFFRYVGLETACERPPGAQQAGLHTGERTALYGADLFEAQPENVEQDDRLALLIRERLKGLPQQLHVDLMIG